MEMTITQGLVALKLTGKKIQDAIARTPVGFVTTAGNKAVPTGFASLDEYKETIKSSLDKVDGLIKYRDKLKKAIVEANARTTVQVGKTQMTVAEAIEKKQSVAHRKSLLKHLKDNYSTAQQQVERANAQLDVRADDYVHKQYGGSAVIFPEEERRKSRENWIIANTAKVVTIDRVRQMIDLYEEEIADFESNVDVSLSVSNAKTLISVED